MSLPRIVRAARNRRAIAGDRAIVTTLSWWGRSRTGPSADLRPSHPGVGPLRVVSPVLGSDLAQLRNDIGLELLKRTEQFVKLFLAQD
jgi:hypothetical protein